MQFSRKNFKYTLTPSIKTLVKRLIDKPSYIKVSPKKLTEYWDIPMDDAKNALAYISQTYGYDNIPEQLDEVSGYSDPNKGKDMEHESKFQEFLKNNGIDEERVVQTYYKQKADGDIRFTVQTRKDSDDNISVIDFTELVIDEFKNYEVQLPPEMDIQSKEQIAIVNIFDAHIDKISNLNFTDKESTLYSNINTVKTAFDKLFTLLKTTTPEKIYFPISNDFFHINSMEPSTKKGTPLHTSTHVDPVESYRKGVALIRYMIETLSTLAPVEVLTILGNHDNDRGIFMNTMFTNLYESTDRITVNEDLKDRQYFKYGTTLFGFTHGEHVKKVNELPSCMSTDPDSKKHWSFVDRGIFFLGHVHHEKRHKTLQNQDFRGCEVKVLRSMSDPDKWHWESGYTGIPKTAYAFLYEKDGNQDQEFKIVI